MNVAVQVLLQLYSHLTTCILTFVNSEPFLIIISYVLDFRLSPRFPQAVCRRTWPSAVERRPRTTRSCPTTIIRTHTRRGADRFCGCAVWLDSRLRYVPSHSLSCPPLSNHSDQIESVTASRCALFMSRDFPSHTFIQLHSSCRELQDTKRDTHPIKQHSVEIAKFKQIS